MTEKSQTQEASKLEQLLQHDWPLESADRVALCAILKEYRLIQDERKNFCEQDASVAQFIQALSKLIQHTSE